MPFTATSLQRVFNVLAIHIAVIDSTGTLIYVNKAWQDFAKENGDPELKYTGLGTNYLNVCRIAAGDSADHAFEVFEGIQQVLKSQTNFFELEYPCHAPHEERWFLMQVTPYLYDEMEQPERGAVIAHINTTRRHRRQAYQLEQARASRRQEELASFDSFTQRNQLAISSESFGVQSLREAFPEEFQNLVHIYGDLLELALEEKAYKVQTSLSDDLKQLAQSLGFFKAGPRDVVELHRQTLFIKMPNTLPQKAQAYVEEGRMVLLELMGNLVFYYRNYSFSTAIWHCSDRNWNRLMNKYVLKLYIAGHTPRSVRAVSNLHRISRNNSNFECEVIIIDVLEQPDLANQDKILATPTLIKVSPPPQRRIIGDLSDPQQVIFILDLPAK